MKVKLTFKLLFFFGGFSFLKNNNKRIVKIIISMIINIAIPIIAALSFSDFSSCFVLSGGLSSFSHFDESNGNTFKVSGFKKFINKLFNKYKKPL